MNDLRVVTQDLDIDQISPNDYNPQEMPKDIFRSLVAHIKARGFAGPIRVRETAPNDPKTIKTKYVVVDGEHRLRAYKEAFPERQTIPVVVMQREDGTPLQRVDALMSTISFNHQHGEANQVKLANVLKEASDYGATLESIEEVTGMKKSRIETLMDFATPPEVKPGKLPDPADPGPMDKIKPQDVALVSFAVTTETQKMLERAIDVARKTLGPEVDEAEKTSEALYIISDFYINNTVQVTPKSGIRNSKK